MGNEITKKECLERFKCFDVGDAQYLLSYQSRSYYTSGKFGWNADAYVFGTIALITGDRPFGFKVDRNIVNDFNSKAKEIVYDSTIKTVDRNKFINPLLQEFLDILRK